jgi:hypothetical protein
MRYTWFSYVLMLAGSLSVPALARVPGNSLEVYAVNVVKTPPFKRQVTGYGVYLGQGMVLTAAHVVGHWPVFTHPRVLVAGLDLPAKLIKKGSFETIDLALLSVDQKQLPVSLRLRRNPICKAPPRIGMAVVDVIPQATIPAQIISPLLIPPALQRRFATLIDTPKESGSGIFDPERECLLGIVSAKLLKYSYQKQNGSIVWAPNGFAGYFVPAAQIAAFFPHGFHY